VLKCNLYEIFEAEGRYFFADRVGDGGILVVAK